MTTATDSFSTGSTLGTDWTLRLGSAYSVSTGKAQGVSATDCAASWGGSWGTATQTAQCAVANLSPGQRYAGPAVLCSGSGTTFNCYMFSSDGTSGTGHTSLYKWDAGAQTELVGYTTTVADNDVLAIKWITGGTLSVFKNGTQVGTNFTDTSLSTGNPGITTYSTSWVDDFSATDGSTGGSGWRAAFARHANQTIL